MLSPGERVLTGAPCCPAPDTLTCETGGGVMSDKETQKPDTDNEVVLGELKVSDDEPKRRLAFHADGRGVEVEGPDELPELVAVAAELWKLTERPPGRLLGFGTLHTENPDGRDDG